MFSLKDLVRYLGVRNKVIKLILGNSYVQVQGTFPKDVLKEVKSVTSYRPEGYQFMQSYKSGRWDGVYHLYQSSYGEQKFPTGMIHDVIEVLKSKSVEYEVVDKRIKPSSETFGFQWNSSFRELRDYQREAVEIAKRRTRGIIRLPTGSGKMLVAAKIIQELGKRATIFVVTQEALKDTYEEFCEAIIGAKIGRWSGGDKELGDIVVATIQSLYEKNRNGAKELFDHYVNSDVVIFDEVHSTGANEYYALSKLTNAFYKFGQSGTPFRGDGKDILLQAATGRIIYKKTTKELQEMGFLAQSKVLFFKSKMPTNQTEETLAQLTPHDKYRATVVENDNRNALIKEIFKKYANQPTLVIVKSEQHLKFLSDYLGIPLVYGKSAKGYRKAVQEQLRSGEMWAVCATKVYDQSVNLPTLKIAINCAGHSPKNAQIQRLGRILRNSGGKDALFIDIWDEWEPSVLMHSKNRLDYLKEEGHDIETKELKFKLDITPEDIIKYRPVKEEKEEMNYEEDMFDEEEE